MVSNLLQNSFEIWRRLLDLGPIAPSECPMQDPRMHPNKVLYSSAKFNSKALVVRATQEGVGSSK